MSLHVFANFVTPFGTAANNRGENEGNITPLQKLLWLGETHTTVSAEAIRFALRRVLGGSDKTNRSWDEAARANVWQDHQFKAWATETKDTFVDDDLLGFMSAEAAKEDGDDDGKGSIKARRAPLEVTRAVSLTPWAGDVTFNAASPGATPSASRGDRNKSKNPVPYGTELHATRYQYGIALTPERLRDKTRAAKALHGLCNLGTVAGNHGRFLFDFSPDAVVIRLTQDPAPRFLYCFETADDGKTLVAPSLLNRLANGDIGPKELVVGVSDPGSTLAGVLKAKGVPVFGVRKACDEAVKQMNAALRIGR
jgi:CRISPR-associated protein Cst2